MFSFNVRPCSWLFLMIGPSALSFTQKKTHADETHESTITVVYRALVFRKVCVEEGICVSMLTVSLSVNLARYRT
ncbi:hypothetical protein HanXRQr2_Chr04g0167761 [Helianthus annuus]|uniref:Secreted protein n=1 Tax=Helianthus annuus TaxID=4232 RepID=A0A251UZG7_HELAN|nr:hypothetical protein HanXRQr2_Chr04g0167761 [Helianthus annuus]KAJ0931416.1 hypothetical protein HanPSC8_Chr04g0161401 [Helianthus annuus]